jgi:hypothetical protein
VVIVASLLALDVDAARLGIQRDVAEIASAGGALGWFFLALLFALPPASLALLIARRWLASVPLGMSAFVWLTWFSYYATPHPTTTGSAAGGVLLFLVFGWLICLLAVVRPWRWRPLKRAAARYLTALDIKPLLRGPDEQYTKPGRLRKGGGELR